MGIYDSNWQEAQERYDEKAEEIADKLYNAYNKLHNCNTDGLKLRYKKVVKELEEKQLIHSNNFGSWVTEPEEGKVKKYVEYLEKKGYMVILP